MLLFGCGRDLFRSDLNEKIVILTGICLGVLSLAGCSKHEASASQHSKESAVTSTSTSKNSSESQQSASSTSSTTDISNVVDRNSAVVVESTQEGETTIAENVNSSIDSELETENSTNISTKDSVVEAVEPVEPGTSESQTSVDWHQIAQDKVAQEFPNLEIASFQPIDDGSLVNVFIKDKETGIVASNAVGSIDTRTGETHGF